MYPWSRPAKLYFSALPHNQTPMVGTETYSIMAGVSMVFFVMALYLRRRFYRMSQQQEMGLDYNDASAHSSHASNITTNPMSPISSAPIRGVINAAPWPTAGVSSPDCPVLATADMLPAAQAAARARVDCVERHTQAHSHAAGDSAIR